MEVNFSASEFPEPLYRQRQSNFGKKNMPQ